MFALLGTSGCATSGEAESLRGEITGLKSRIEGLEKRDAAAKMQVVRLREVLDQGTALLTRNSADVGAKAARAEAELAAQNGKLAELQHTVDQLQQQITDERSRMEAMLSTMDQTQQKLVQKVSPNIPEDKDAHWKEASARRTGGQHEDARRFYRAYIQKYPQDARASQAQLALGEIYFAEQKYPLAAGELQKVLDSFPKSPEVPDAMWHLSLSFQELKFCSDATALLKDLSKRYPKSPRSADAKKQLKHIQKLTRDPAKCTS